MKKLTKHLVLYIDMLGTTNKIDDDSAQETVLNNIWEIISLAKSLISADKKGMKIQTFSDNIVLATEVENNIPFYPEIFCAAAILQKLFIARYAWAVRGAIVVDDFYIDEDLVWGKALVKAHTIEEKVAIYPRIIVDNSIVEELKRKNSSYIDDDIIEDDDGMYYINYNTLNLKEKHSKTFVGFEENLRKMCEAQYDSPSIQEKYNWLRRNVLDKL